MIKKKFLLVGLFTLVFCLIPARKVSAGIDEKLYNETEARAHSDFKNMAPWFSIFRDSDENQSWWGTVGSVKYMWKRSLDATLPNIISQGRQTLGNEVGDTVTYQFLEKPPLNDAGNGDGVRTADCIWLGYVWAMASSKFYTDKTFFSDDGQISLNIKTKMTNDNSGLPKYTITFRREAERIDQQYSSLNFNLNGLQSQFDFYNSYSYPSTNWLGITSQVQLLNKYHLLSEITTPLAYDFSGWIKQENYAKLSGENIHTTISERGGEWSVGQGITSFTDEKGVSHDISEALDAGMLKVSGTVNLEAAGVYPVTYSYSFINELNDEETVQLISNVTVDGTWIESKNPDQEIVLYQEDPFNYGDLVEIKNSLGNQAVFDESVHIKSSPLTIQDGKLVSTPGNYQVVFQLSLPWKDNEIREIVVHIKVIADSLNLSIPESLHFGTYQLGQPDTRLLWPSDQPIVVEDDRKTKGPWELKVKIDNCNNQDFSTLVVVGDAPLSQSVRIFSSDGGEATTIVNKNWDANTGIVIDYAPVSAPRADSGVIEWMISPSTKGVSE